MLVSSVALAFISFWRAAAIVLCDLASTAYYIGGISEQAIGKAAPWFILGVMLFSYAVRAVYVESCTMFTRGGVYKRGEGGDGRSAGETLRLRADVRLHSTGPISAVVGRPIHRRIVRPDLQLISRTPAQPNGTSSMRQPTHRRSTSLCVADRDRDHRLLLADEHHRHPRIARQGASHHAAHHGDGLSHHRLELHDALHAPGRAATAAAAPGLHQRLAAVAKARWAGLSTCREFVGTIGIIVAFGHSLLAMSGEESLAQVNREIEAPKLKNLLRAGFVIFLYSLLLTSLISFLAVLIIPEANASQRKSFPTAVKRDGRRRVVKVDYLRQDAATGKDVRLQNDRRHSAGRPSISREKVSSAPTGSTSNAMTAATATTSSTAWPISRRPELA